MWQSSRNSFASRRLSAGQPLCRRPSGNWSGSSPSAHGQPGQYRGPGAAGLADRKDPLALEPGRLPGAGLRTPRRAALYSLRTARSGVLPGRQSAGGGGLNHGLWKSGLLETVEKSKKRWTFPPFPQPLGIPLTPRDSHFPTARRRLFFSSEQLNRKPHTGQIVCSQNRSS